MSTGVVSPTTAGVGDLQAVDVGQLEFSTTASGAACESERRAETPSSASSTRRSCLEDEGATKRVADRLVVVNHQDAHESLQVGRLPEPPSLHRGHLDPRLHPDQEPPVLAWSSRSSSTPRKTRCSTWWSSPAWWSWSPPCPSWPPEEVDVEDVEVVGLVVVDVLVDPDVDVEACWPMTPTRPATPIVARSPTARVEVWDTPSWRGRGSPRPVRCARGPGGPWGWGAVRSWLHGAGRT